MAQRAQSGDKRAQQKLGLEEAKVRLKRLGLARSTKRFLTSPVVLCAAAHLGGCADRRQPDPEYDKETEILTIHGVQKIPATIHGISTKHVNKYSIAEYLNYGDEGCLEKMRKQSVPLPQGWKIWSCREDSYSIFSTDTLYEGFLKGKEKNVKWVNASIHTNMDRFHTLYALRDFSEQQVAEFRQYDYLAERLPLPDVPGFDLMFKGSTTYYNNHHYYYWKFDKSIICRGTEGTALMCTIRRPNFEIVFNENQPQIATFLPYVDKVNRQIGGVK